MPTLGTQNISTSYPQLLKTFTTGGLSGTIQVITDGDDTSSALSLSTTGVRSTGTFAVDGTSLLSGVVTFGTSLTASTGTATIGTLSASTATISTATISTATISTSTISTATIPNILGAVTFGSNITASTGTATIGTLFASGPATFGSTITASTGTNTFGTISVNQSTVGTKRYTNSTGAIIGLNYTTSTFTGATVSGNTTSTGTFAQNGVALSDIIVGSLNSLGSATAGGSQAFGLQFFPKAANVVQYNLNNCSNTSGTVPAGTLYSAAYKFTV